MDYTVGWICALETEYVAAQSFLDLELGRPDVLSPNDNNDYVLGMIGGHHVVIAVLPDGEYGTVSAANVARDMLHSFPNIRFGLMVGIGGGAPNPKHDIRLGDIVVSSSQGGGHGGVLQYDFGKELQDRKFQPTGLLNQPPTVLRTAVTGLRAQHGRKGHQLEQAINAILQDNKKMRKKYERPDGSSDRLFESQFIHPRDVEGSCAELCDLSKLISRAERDEDEDLPVIHYGLIASGNKLIKDAGFRDTLAREQNILCFEMEAAGLMNHFPCLVIRGICDYADSHKNKEWQGFAAMAAAAYAKELLCRIVPQRVNDERKACEVLDGIQKELGTLSANVDSVQQNFELPVAEGASYDSYKDQHVEKCLPGTRRDLLRQIIDWAETSDKCIFWLNGMAGTGKSTISRTVAKLLQDKGLLGASFFFKRGEADRGNARRFTSTIAKQLMARYRQLTRGIIRAIRDNADLSNKALDQQFEKLLLQPLREGEQYETTSVIVIDALDECEDDDIGVLLRLLPQLQESKSIRLRILLTSRPELPIRRGFKQTQNYHDRVLQEVPGVEDDIRIFLNHKFYQIKERREIHGDWPGDKTMEELVRMSVPLFIFAATVCRFVGEDYQVPQKMLDRILKKPDIMGSSQMERIYLPILKHRVESYPLLKDQFRNIIGPIILLADPLSVHSLSVLIGIDEQTIMALLDAFHSVLNVPRDYHTPVRILHLSFREFLVSTQEEYLRIDETKSHQKLLQSCLQVMKDPSLGLRHNMCRLPSYGIQREDIDSHTIFQYIPQVLQYSCRYWVYHVSKGKSDAFEIKVFSFLKEYFLHWLEAMSLMGLASETIGIVNALRSRLRDSMSTELEDFLKDANRFVLKHVQMIDNTPLQVYCSGLAFSPTESVIRKVFHNQRPNWMPDLPQVQKSWSAELQTLEGHSDWVSSVVFSPDGQRIVSGSDDHTIKLWDAQTGAELRTLEGHSNWVYSVAFSPDGQRIVSGSVDQTIKLWDAQTGAELRTLEGHSDWVNLVAFSPDGQRIVSGSGNKTIKLWDAQTGAELRTLEGHSDSVDSVASGNTHMEHNQGSQISVENSWVYWRGKSVIWLPPEFRGHGCHATNHDILALGYPTGRVLVIRFRAPSD